MLELLFSNFYEFNASVNGFSNVSYLLLSGITTGLVPILMYHDTVCRETGQEDSEPRNRKLNSTSEKKNIRAIFLDS